MVINLLYVYKWDFCKIRMPRNAKYFTFKESIPGFRSIFISSIDNITTKQLFQDIKARSAGLDKTRSKILKNLVKYFAFLSIVCAFGWSNDAASLLVTSVLVPRIS